MKYDEINLKHIRTSVFMVTQNELSEILDIAYRTYQNYELNGIPVSKRPGIKRKLIEHAKKIGVDTKKIDAQNNGMEEPKEKYISKSELAEKFKNITDQEFAHEFINRYDRLKKENSIVKLALEKDVWRGIAEILQSDSWRKQAEALREELKQ